MKANKATTAVKSPASATQPPTRDLSEPEALQALIEAHNAESKAIIEYIRAHNRAAMEAAKARQK